MDAHRLGAGQRIGYGVGDLGINLYFISAMTYLLYFYTDVFGLSAAAAGGVFLVARIVDAVTDPIMGLIAERTHTRWGRFRPWILAGALPLGLVAVLTFSAPDFDPQGRVIWAYATYVTFGVLYTVVAIPYAALTASLTADHHERTLLSTVRMAFAFGGGYAVSVGMLPLVDALGGGAVGFSRTVTAFAVAATLLLVITAVTARERVQADPALTLPLHASLRAVFVNPPLLLVMVLFTCGMLSFTIRQTVTPFYFKYNLGREDLVPAFFAVTMPVMLVALAGVPYLADRFGKAGAMIVGALVTVAGCLGLHFTPYDAIAWIFFWSCVVALGGTPIAVLGWAMIPDTVEYAQWRHGVRADGAIFSFASFFQKLAKAIGGAGVAAALAVAGFVANELQGAATVTTIHNLMTLAPVAVMVALIVAARAYRLDKQAHAELVARLGGSSAAP